MTQRAPLQAGPMDTLGQVGTSVERRTNGAPPAPKDACRAACPELIDRLRAGDPAARTAVVRRYHSALVYQASRILRDKGLAEDVVQDAWLAAFASLRKSSPWDRQR